MPRPKTLTPPELAARYVSPPEYAAQLGVKPGKVISWIESGELRAVNVASKKSSRPRWRISPDAIVAFENGHAVQPATTARRRRRKQPADVVQYF